MPVQKKRGRSRLLPRRNYASAAAATAAVVVGCIGAAAVIPAAAEQQEQDDDPPAVAAEAIGIAIHSQEPPVWILSTRLIPCYDGGLQTCGAKMGIITTGRAGGMHRPP